MFVSPDFRIDGTTFASSTSHRHMNTRLDNVLEARFEKLLALLMHLCRLVESFVALDITLPNLVFEEGLKAHTPISRVCHRSRQ
mmetsp:Transcript_29400/g.90849  ORF Transcript_29400/g.90849 Transcript_29400/m.90849 type:complete len:84 (-) Transcript_29400:18-269(-)